MRISIGRAVMGFFPSAPPIARLWSTTSEIRPSTTVSSPFRRNTAVFWKNTGSNLMNAMCGIDHHFAPSRMGSVWPVGDLALGGFAPSRIGSVWPVGDFVRGGSAPSGLGFAWPVGDSALGGFAPSGLGLSGGTIPPRVAPWAVSLRPVGASNRVNPSFPAPTGRYVIAQGNAP